jgi:peptidyl-prolyl cis-trans isomerase C
MRKFALVPLVLIVFFLGACSGTGKGKNDSVMAVVNGHAITETSFEEEAKMLPPYVKPILETPSGRMQILESMITRDILMQEALRRGIDRREDVRERLNMARRSVILEALLREVSEKAPGLSDESLRKFYEANKDSFQVGERVGVSHILFKDRAEAEEAAKRVKGGTPFDEMAKAAAKKGVITADLGMIERGKFDKTFEAAAFAAAPGSVAGPVKTAYGYHLIRVGEKKPAGLQSFEEVKGQILSDLRQQAQRDAFEAFLAELKKQSRIQVMVKQEAAPPPVETPLPRGGR